MAHYEFVKGENGRLVGKGNYPWQMVCECGGPEAAEVIARQLEEKTGKACKADASRVWIQGDRNSEEVRAALALILD